jgi:hypothetical protein
MIDWQWIEREAGIEKSFFFGLLNTGLNYNAATIKQKCVLLFNGILNG